MSRPRTAAALARPAKIAKLTALVRPAALFRLAGLAKLAAHAEHAKRTKLVKLAGPVRLAAHAELVRPPKLAALAASLSRLALIALLAPGCGGSGARPELVVCAAASTRDALLALEPTYERERGVELVLSFGSSGALARQIVAGGAADVFLSADERELDRVEQAGLVLPGARRALLSNQLVVVEPADAPSPFTAPFDAAQLAGPGVRLLSLADPETVPAGRYAAEWLARRGAWDALRGRVLPGVDVRAALAAVEAGAAQAGVVYRTDAARSRAVRTVYAVPVAEGPDIAYPVAALAGRGEAERARAFVDYLASPAAREAFEREGFVFLPGATGGER